MPFNANKAAQLLEQDENNHSSNPYNQENFQKIIIVPTSIIIILESQIRPPLLCQLVRCYEIFDS